MLASIRRLKNLAVLFIKYFTFRNYVEEVIMLAQKITIRRYAIVSSPIIFALTIQMSKA